MSFIQSSIPIYIQVYPTTLKCFYETFHKCNKWKWHKVKMQWPFIYTEKFWVYPDPKYKPIKSYQVSRKTAPCSKSSATLTAPVHADSTVTCCKTNAECYFHFPPYFIFCQQLCVLTHFQEKNHPMISWN